MPFWKRCRSELDLAREAFAGNRAGEGVTGDLPCTEPGCGREDAVRCVYMDRRGRSCRSAVCPEHQHPVDGEVHCRLHADTVRAVGQLGNEQLRPDVDNPAPLLVSWTARDLHDRLREMLDRSLATDSSERILVDDNVTPIRAVDGSRRWEQAWKIVSHLGVVLKVSVQVDEAAPAGVVIRVGPRAVAQASPPWFARFQRGERIPADQAAAERVAFYEPVFVALEAAVLEERSAGVRGPY